MSRYDVIVLGLGAMGSAASWQLARKGARVLGLDRFAPPHEMGSSHGDTRITRLAIGEGEHLTPLVLRAHDIWRQIEQEAGASLLTTNGELIISSDSKGSRTHVEGFFGNTVAAARRFGIAHELLDATAIRRRFPAFKVRDDEVGYFEPGAGFLRPERCIGAQLALARRCSAELRFGEPALRVEEDASGATVTTARETYRSDRLIISAGPWLPGLIARSYAQLFRVYRQTLFWFELQGSRESWVPERFPVFIWELQTRRQGVYGFPAIDEENALKVATEQYDATTSPDGVNRAVSESESAETYTRYVAPYVDGVGPKCLRSAVCLYTVTPDAGFVIDWLPGSKRILVASPCSGHGFKHSAAIGEILADLVRSETSRFDVTPFGFKRFA